MMASCERCRSVEILDGLHKICYECFVELDLEFHESELIKELGVEEE